MKGPSLEAAPSVKHSRDVVQKVIIFAVNTQRRSEAAIKAPLNRAKQLA